MNPGWSADLYASELQGLTSTIGRKVSIGIRAKQGAELVDVLNDLPQTIAGNYQLPNLRHGQELNVGVWMQLPAWATNQEIASVRLAWDSPAPQGRQSLVEHLTLLVQPKAELEELQCDPVVAEQIALLKANRERRQAIEALEQGDLQGARFSLTTMDERLADLPQSTAIQRDRQLLLAEKRALMQGDCNLSRKRLRRESLRSSLSVWDSDK